MQRSETITGAPQALQHYADRGVLTQFSSQSDRVFRFRWLTLELMEVEWTAAKRTIIFKDLLPNIALHGPIHAELCAFMRSRTSADLPEHRRVDPSAFDLLCRNRRSQVSIGLKVNSSTGDAAVHKLMLIVHEVFLMMNSRWPEYMQQQFGFSED